MNDADTLTLTLTILRGNVEGDVRYRIEFDGEVREGAVRASDAKTGVLEATMHIVMSIAADEMTSALEEMFGFPANAHSN